MNSTNSFSSYDCQVKMYLKNATVRVRTDGYTDRRKPVCNLPHATAMGQINIGGNVIYTHNVGTFLLRRIVLIIE